MLYQAVQRNDLLDSAKGIGMILVFAGHLFSYGNIPFSIIFSFHMPLFFIISGFLFNPNKYCNLKSVICGLSRNLILPYLFFILLALFVLVVRTLLWNVEFPTIQCILYESFYLWQPNFGMLGATWFLSCLFMVQLLVWCMVTYIKQTPLYIFMQLISLIIVMFLLSHVNKIIKLPMNLYSVAPASIFFYISYLFGDKILMILGKKWNLWIISFLIPINILIALLNRTVNIAIPVYNNYILYFFNSFIGTILILYIAKSSIFNILRFYGRHSLMMFSLHGFWLFTYAGIISAISGKEYHIMENIPNGLCLIGIVFVSLISIPSFYIVNPLYLKYKKLV